MAAKLFARLRVRRGNYVDVPNPLLGSEFGHAIDQQRLFLGNGALSDGAPTTGNTEVLTEYSPNMILLQYDYISNTLTIANTSRVSLTGSVSVSGTIGHTGTLVINTISVAVSSSNTVTQIAAAINTAAITNITGTTYSGTYLQIVGSNGQSINIGAGSTSAVLTALGLVVGTTAASPVYRSLQSVLDTTVNVLDYGAKGDGVTDDSSAINQAILNLYTSPLAVGQYAQSVRRTLFFPAGIYNIIANKIVLPPHCRLVGEGKNASQLILSSTSTLDHIFQTCDGLGQTGAAIGTNSAELPNDITVENMGFIRTVYGSVGNLNRCNTVYFRKCLFNSAWTSGSGSNLLDVSKLGSVVPMNNFVFDECEFTAYYDLFTLSTASNVYDMSFVTCHFHNAYRGIYFSNSIKNIKVVGCQFRSLSDRGIYADTSASLIKSISNSFVSVGVTNVVAPIEYTSSSTQCSSVSDTFDTGLNSIINNSANGLTQNAYGNGLFQNVTYSPRIGPVTLADNTTGGSTGISLPLASVLGAYINYVLIRNGDYRIGTLTIASDGSSNAYLYDENSENSISGTTFLVAIVGGNIVVNYNTTSTGYTAQFSYSYRYF